MSSESSPDFRPTASPAVLRARAAAFARVRRFFDARNVLEVDVPILARAGTVDEHIDPLVVDGRNTGAGVEKLFLMTSPEHGMKRLLAAGTGPIYQLAHVFRAGERGRRHNTEFTLLEWYRPGFALSELMDEVEELVGDVMAAIAPHRHAGASRPFERLSYAEAFQRDLGLDPHTAPMERLRAAVEERGVLLAAEPDGADRDAWLNVLLACCLEPSLGVERPTFLYDYPATQAAAARIRDDKINVAERFELYCGGVEVANGYHELRDAAEQLRRFEAANDARAKAGRPRLPVDTRLVEALQVGLPECSGVALGMDRLLMVALGETSIDAVLPFPVERA